jgi:uncharacterized protein
MTAGLARQGAILVAIVAFALMEPGAPARAEDSGGTLLTFSEHAERSLPRDRVGADLAVEATDTDATKLQATINRRMAAALTKAKAAPNIAVTSRGYSVYEERGKDDKRLWHGQQGLQLEAKDSSALLELVGALQGDGLVVTGMTSSLSHEAEQAVEDELTAMALQRVRERAGRIASDLTMKVARLKTVRVGNVGRPPVPLMRAMAPGAMSAAMPAPVVAPGDAVVSVEVEVEVELVPQR